jgi:hypothetical protein
MNNQNYRAEKSPQSPNKEEDILEIKIHSKLKA